MTRLAILVVALVFITGFAFLTIEAIASQGLTLGGALSICIIVLLGVGIVGALGNPPRR